MRSMRRQLLLWLMLGIVVSSTFSGLSVYRYTRREIDELYNAHLQQLAVMLAQQLNEVDNDQFRSSIIPTIKSLDRWEEEVYLIQLWDKDGHLHAATTSMADTLSSEIPLQAHAGLFSRIIDGQRWRIYRADGEDLTVQIAQPEQARGEVIHEISRRVMVPLLFQIPILAMLALLAVRRGLRPLDQLSAAIEQRHPSALDPLNAQALPTDLQPLVHTLNALLERLAVALQQQRDFVADAAHELRTPLAALQLQLDLLRRAESVEDRELTLEQLGKGVRRATGLVGQLLRVARLEAAPAEEAVVDVSLQFAAGEAIERHLAAARARDIDLGVTALEVAAIRCAPSDIETIFDNLLGNAIRYTPNGGKVDVAIRRGDGVALIDVIDNGIGIPEAERTRIFDRFHRVLTLHAASVADGGSGLGLAIVKSICDRYRATIAVDSGPNATGTRFRIAWPLAD